MDADDADALQHGFTRRSFSEGGFHIDYIQKMFKKFFHFVAGEILNLSVSYLAGLSASMLVSEFFVRKKLGNLWGLTAKKEAVSRDDYEWLMFGASYFIGLTVMLVVSYTIRRLQGEKNPA